MEQLDPIWCAEFRGFFWADGTLYANVRKVSKNGKTFFRPMMRISVAQRADNGMVLDDFKSKLGCGTIYRYPLPGTTKRKWSRNAKPQVRWSVDSISGCRIVIDVLKGSVLPTKKGMEVALLDEFIAIREKKRLRGKRNFLPVELDRLRVIAEMLHQNKQYSGGAQ